MSKAIKRQNQHFNPYFYHNFILIQCIVSEFINIIKFSENFNQPRTDLLPPLQQLLGSLGKLKEYCFQYNHNAHLPDQIALALNVSVQQAWFNVFRYIESSYCSNHAQALKELSSKFNEHLHPITLYIFELLKQHCDDQHVMRFLLDKQLQLTDIYGPHFFSKISIKGSSKKEKSLFQQLLDKQYSQKL